MPWRFAWWRRPAKRAWNITIDLFPYRDNGIDLTQLLPRWAIDGGPGELKRLLGVPGDRARVARFVAASIHEEGGSGRNLYVRGCNNERSLSGMTLADLSVRWYGGDTSELEAEGYLRMLETDNCVIDVAGIAEEDIVAAIKAPFSMIASDGGIRTHPKSYGTRARILGRYVREQHALSIEQAIRKMTSLPAQRLNIWDRGLLRPGLKADLVVFDPSRIIDCGTRPNPQFSEGIDSVFVNARPVLLHGKITGERPGRILMGPAFRGQN